MPNDALVNIWGIYITEKLSKLLQLRSELLRNISKIIVFMNRRNTNTTNFRWPPRKENALNCKHKAMLLWKTSIKILKYCKSAR